MAITLAGTPFNDIKQTAYSSLDDRNVNAENNRNSIDTMLFNIQAASTNGRTFAGVFPNMNQIENDICNWY